jgi:hypothetical protein
MSDVPQFTALQSGVMTSILKLESELYYCLSDGVVLGRFIIYVLCFIVIPSIYSKCSAQINILYLEYGHLNFNPV